MSSERHILLVEDDPKDAELTLAALAECDLSDRVDVVNDGEEALDYLLRRNRHESRAGKSPAVVMLDLKMPKLTGLETLERMRSDRRLRTIPVVILTSSREERDIVESYELGANAYVVKPVEFDSFVEAIMELGLFWAVINQVPHGDPTGG